MKFFDRVKETATTTGTGDFTLAGATTGFRTFASVLSTNDTCYYCISLQGGSEWEVGLGTYSAANTLTRTTVLSSSNSDAAVNFSAGTKDVSLTVAAREFNIPVVKADKNSTNQTGIAASTWSKVTFTNEIKDTHGYFSNSTFTPLIEGEYQIVAQVRFDGIAADKRTYTAIYKNGAAAAKSAESVASLGVSAPIVVDIISCNGTTDYIDIYALHDDSVSRDISGDVAYTFIKIVKVA